MTAAEDASPREHFLEAMSRAATGVTIVTTRDGDQRFGQTVSAMSSVSADPPLLLACINRKSPTCAAIGRSRVFAVNVLRADQRALAQMFAGRPLKGDPYDFTAARWEAGATGAPILTGAVASFDCELDAAYDAGTHTIFVGRVVAAEAGAGAPLVYAGRGYGELHAFPRGADTADWLLDLDPTEGERLEL